jgi:hypothetical protein
MVTIPHSVFVLLPHHRANLLVPHLLTVRATFNYFAAQSFDDSLPFKVSEHPTVVD